MRESLKIRTLRAVVALIGFALLASTAAVPAVAASAVKPGAVCSKKGNTRTVGGKTFTCVVVKKKLIWNKGVAVRPAAGPSQQSSVIPTPVDGRLRAFTCELLPVKATSLTETNVCQVVSNGIRALQARLDASPNVESPVIIKFDDELPQDWVTAERRRIADSYRFWYPILKDEEITFLYWLKNSKQGMGWANAIWQDMQTRYYRSSNPSTIDHLDRSERCQAGDSSNWIERDLQGKVITKNHFITNICAGDREPSAAFKSVHEFAHHVQTHLHMNGQAPIWVIEGGAEYFGEILGNYRADPSLLWKWRCHKSAVWGYGASGWSKSEWDDYTRRATLPGGNAQQAYYLGALMTELLIGTFGIDRYIAFMQTYLKAPYSLMTPERVDHGAFLDASMREVYGITASAFYDAAFGYVTAAAKRYESGSTGLNSSLPQNCGA